MGESSARAGDNLRILFLTQYYPPEVAAAPARALHFARALARAGHAVTVVTGLPNHPSGVIQPGFQPGETKTSDGITVRRTWLYATPRKTPLDRLRNHLSFAVSAHGAAVRGGPYDLVLVTVPPLFIGVTGWLTSVRHRAPLIIDVRDDWPRAAIALGEMRPGLIAAGLDGLAGFLYQRATRVIAVTKGMQGSLTARGIDAGRQVLITNGADTETFRPAADLEVDGGAAATGDAGPSAARPFTILYAGTHGLIHGMEVLLDAAEILEREGLGSGPSGLRFLLVGDGVAKAGLMEGAARRGLASIEFRPAESPADLAVTTAAADLCVATTRNHPFSGETIPVKLFDYLAAGKPVVAAVSGDAAEVVRASGGGVVTPPGDGAALAAAIAALARHPEQRRAMGMAGATFVEANYSRRVLGERLAALCEEVVRLRRGRAVEAAPRGLDAFAKRAFDLAAATSGILLLSPVFLLLALLVRVDSPGPVLFRQRRPGRGSREFIMLKFRTMRIGTPDLATHLVGEGTSYVTRIGRILRRTSLDELPQLWNVLRGEMSLVGPRPALYNQYDLIALRQERGVDALRPGVTGWAQVNGRDEIPMDRKVALDEEYLRRAGFFFDLSILWRTVAEVFTGRGTR